MHLQKKTKTVLQRCWFNCMVILKPAGCGAVWNVWSYTNRCFYYFVRPIYSSEARMCMRHKVEMTFNKGWTMFVPRVCSTWCDTSVILIIVNGNKPSNITLQNSSLRIHVKSYKDDVSREMFWTYLPTLSAPRSGSDLRMWWKSSACSLGGVFQDRRKSSAYRRR